MIDPDILQTKTVHWGEIDALVRAFRKVDPLSSLEHLRYSLEQWWCLQYNRPLKDPLLKEYNLNELIYEFLFHHYQKPENDPDKPKPQEIDKEDEEWALKQIQEMNKKEVPPPQPTPQQPTTQAQAVPPTEESPALPTDIPSEIRDILEKGEEFSTQFDG